MGDADGDDDDPDARLWQVDRAMYNIDSPPRKTQEFVQRIKTLSVLLVIGVLFVYPLLLVYIGLVYGWLAFYGTLFGSVTLIGLTLRGLGFDHNFQNAGTGSLGKGILYLTAGFLGAAAVYEGLFYLKEWVVPLMAIVLIAGLSIKILRR